jgi:hypothetical protein
VDAPLQPKSSLAASPPAAIGACRDWVLAIKEVPEGLTTGASRLASPPPEAEEGTVLPSSWDDGDETLSAEKMLLSPQHADVLQPILALSEVPDS